ncbi:hypothetical protein HXX76_011942 [Chlamydomonas incerta]|uniref:Photolyase/cryptochrome alpha/beta domain-containing protein n=1 Tax=Chlamydomonas incerta TaxID=51695 RepID=A0A835SWS5_CHLIN|nr:hypothetical protein HXX76_011942 [Chlamydomonas incerta]|eukprot:KAG2427955.1 hypothetical protein HXX76_011942 [Chlamydomonas incerta]
MPYEFKTAVVWFRRDLRVDDNPALVAALAAAPNVIPVFIWAPEEEGQFQPGRCSRWWSKHSLVDLQQALAALGSRLVIRRSTDSTAALLQLVTELGAEAVFFNHLYDPISLMRDHDCKRGLTAAGVAHRTFNGDMLYEPWDVLDPNKQPYSTFDDFWNSVRSMPVPPPFPVSAPASMPAVPAAVPSLTVAEVDWFFTPEQEASSDQLKFKWKPGVGGAISELEHFLSDRLQGFEHDRAKVDRDSTSRLSPWIHIGSISVRYIFYRVRQCQAEWLAGGADTARSCDDFLQQMGYREYSRYLAFHFPFIHERSLLRHLRACPWRIDQHAFKAWRQGQTGYPIVDAAMRQLWSSGWCHNRGRVVAASFLVKDLLLPWQWGLKHYWDAQIDADLECDALGWQYVSGGMSDAHPFSYMMDLETEARRFDPDGEYVRRWLPALSRLPTEYIHAPWKAPPSVLAAADVELGCNYPLPIITRGDAKANVDYACGVLEKSAVAPSGSDCSGRYPYRAPTYPKAGGGGGASGGAVGAVGAGSSGGNPTAAMGGASGSGGAGPSSGTGTGGQGGAFRGAGDGGGSAPVSQQGGMLPPGVAVCVTAGTSGAQPDSRTVSGAHAGVCNSAGGVACDMPPPSHPRGGSSGVVAAGVGGVSGGRSSGGEAAAPGAARKAPAPGGGGAYYHPGESSGEGHALLERILQQQRRQRGAAQRQDGSGTNQPPPPPLAAPGLLDAVGAAAAAAAAAGGGGMAALPGLLHGLHGGAGATAAAAVAWASRVAAGGVDDLDAVALWQQQQLLQGGSAAFAFEQAMELLLARRRAGDGVSGFRGGDAPGRGGGGADGPDGLMLDEEDSEEVVSNTVDLNLTAFTGASCHRQSGTARGARAAERRFKKAAGSPKSPAGTDAGGSAGAGAGAGCGEEDAMQCEDEEEHGEHGTPPRRAAAADPQEGGEDCGEGSEGAGAAAGEGEEDEGGYDSEGASGESGGEAPAEDADDMVVDGGGGGGGGGGQHKRRRSQSEGELRDAAWE